MQVLSARATLMCLIDDDLDALVWISAGMLEYVHLPLAFEVMRNPLPSLVLRSTG